MDIFFISQLILKWSKSSKDIKTNDATYPTAVDS